jgi:hypothetical protein
MPVVLQEGSSFNKFQLRDIKHQHFYRNNIPNQSVKKPHNFSNDSLMKKNVSVCLINLAGSQEALRCFEGTAPPFFTRTTHMKVSGQIHFPTAVTSKTTKDAHCLRIRVGPKYCLGAVQNTVISGPCRE